MSLDGFILTYLNALNGLMKIAFNEIKTNNFINSLKRVELSKTNNNKIKKWPLASSSIVVDDILSETLDANNEQNRIQNLINADTIFYQNSSYSLNENLDVPSRDSIEDILSSLQLHYIKIYTVKRSLASNISSNKSDYSISDKNIKSKKTGEVIILH